MLARLGEAAALKGKLLLWIVVIKIPPMITTPPSKN